MFFEKAAFEMVLNSTSINQKLVEKLSKQLIQRAVNADETRRVAGGMRK